MAWPMGNGSPLCPLSSHTLLSSGSSTTTTFPSITRMMSVDFLPALSAFSALSSGRTRTATMREDWLVLGTYCVHVWVGRREGAFAATLP